MTAKVGQSVVYRQSDDSGPLSHYQARIHPALVAGVAEDGSVDLVVFPFGAYSPLFVSRVIQRSDASPLSSGRCWYYPE